MNIDTGKLKMLPPDSDLSDRMKIMELSDLTSKQIEKMQVSLHDHKSVAGQILTAIRRAERNKYTPHKGAKELARDISRMDITQDYEF